MAILFGASLALALHFWVRAFFGLVLGRGLREFGRSVALAFGLLTVTASVACAKTLFFLPAQEFETRYRARQLAAFISDGMNLSAIFSVFALGLVLYSFRKRPLSSLAKNFPSVIPSPCHESRRWGANRR